MSLKGHGKVKTSGKHGGAFHAGAGPTRLSRSSCGGRALADDLHLKFLDFNGLFETRQSYICIHLLPPHPRSIASRTVLNTKTLKQSQSYAQKGVEMSLALRPCLRPNSLPSLPSSTTTSTTYICQSCRHARLIKRPKRPYTFTQLVTLSDGSAFTMRTTSPIPVYRSTRDTRNSALWNPTSKELLNVEDDESGRLASFRARFGTSFDTQKATKKTDQSPPPSPTADIALLEETRAAPAREPMFEEEQNMFAEDDINLLDFVSSFGQGNKQQNQQSQQPPPASKKGGKK